MEADPLAKITPSPPIHSIAAATQSETEFTTRSAVPSSAGPGVDLLSFGAAFSSFQPRLRGCFVAQLQEGYRLRGTSDRRRKTSPSLVIVSAYQFHSWCSAGRSVERNSIPVGEVCGEGVGPCAIRTTSPWWGSSSARPFCRWLRKLRKAAVSMHSGEAHTGWVSISTASPSSSMLAATANKRSKHDVLRIGNISGVEIRTPLRPSTCRIIRTLVEAESYTVLKFYPTHNRKSI